MALTVNCFGSGTPAPKKIEVTTMPTQTKQWHLNKFDPTGLVVSLTKSDNSVTDVTDKCYFGTSTSDISHKANELELNTVGSSIPIYVKWSGSKVLITTFYITVYRKPSKIIVEAVSSVSDEYIDGDTINLANHPLDINYTDGTSAEWVYSNGAWATTDSEASNAHANIEVSPTICTYTSGSATQPVIVTYKEHTDEFNDPPSVSGTYFITVSPCKIVTWANGTDAEIQAMVDAADAGKIKLSDYWTVGDERKVTLSAMAATGVGESHNSESVTFVLMNVGGKTLTNGKECNFVVGLKNCLSTTGYMNSSDTNSGGWDKCARRAWCNNVFYNAIPSSFRGIFKQFKNKTGLYESQSTLSETTDYFALPAAKEVYSIYNHSSYEWFSTTTEWNALSGFSYYNTSANRIKKQGDNGSAEWYRLRSPFAISSSSFCIIYSDGGASSYNASIVGGLAPFGCI